MILEVDCSATRHVTSKPTSIVRADRCHYVAWHQERKFGAFWNGERPSVASRLFDQGHSHPCLRAVIPAFRPVLSIQQRALMLLGQAKENWMTAKTSRNSGRTCQELASRYPPVSRGGRDLKKTVEIWRHCALCYLDIYGGGGIFRLGGFAQVPQGGIMMFWPV